jgi:hypothetical protein
MLCNPSPNAVLLSSREPVTLGPMASTKKMSDDRARYWKSVMVQHLRERPFHSLEQANASIVAELERRLGDEIEAERQKTKT